MTARRKNVSIRRCRGHIYIYALDNLKFLYRVTFRNVLSILKPTCKNVKKMLGTWKRITRAYIYALGSQRVKIRFKRFWIDSDQKIFSTTIFYLCRFFTILTIFTEKRLRHTKKNFTREKIFDFDIFGLKYVFKHSESIPTKKIFRPKFFTFVIFSLFWSFLPKND